MSPEEAARRLREAHPITAEGVQRVVALLRCGRPAQEVARCAS